MERERERRRRPEELKQMDREREMRRSEEPDGQRERYNTRPGFAFYSIHFDPATHTRTCQ